MRRLLWIPVLFAAVPVMLLIALLLVPERWIADRIENYVRSSQGLELSIGTLRLHWWSWTPSAALDDVSLAKADDPGMGGADASPIVAGANLSGAIDLRRLLRGQLVVERVALSHAAVDVRIDESGVGNWQALLPGSQQAPQKGDETDGAVPAIRLIEIENVRLDYRDARLGRELAATLSASGSTTDPERPTRISIEGTLDGLPFVLGAELAALGALADSLDALALDATATLGDTRLALEGTVGDPTTLAALDVTFDLDAADARDLEALAGLSLPELPPFSLRGELGRDAEAFVLRRFDGELGDSDIQGDIRVDPSTTPLTAYANVISKTFDLDDLAGLLGAVPDPEETATAEQQAKSAAQETDGRLLPDEPLDLKPLVTAFNGAIRFRAEQVTSRYPIDSLDLKVEVEGDSLAVRDFAVGLGGGAVAGTLVLDVRPVPAEGSIDLSITRVNLRDVMTSIGIDDESFGRIGGQAKYWIRGNSVASFAASADGGMFLLMTDGKLDALLVELAGIDLVESIMLLLDPEKTLTNINCGYLDLHTAEGVSDINRFVLDTDDTVFIADGTIDLGEESFDIGVEPHPKDVTLLGAQTSVRISGRVGDISVVPGKELPLRAAAAAALATVAAPLAAILPFIQTGSGENSPYCDGLATSLDEAR